MNMRNLIDLVESRSIRAALYYHGSYDRLPIGTILTSRSDYHARWSSSPFFPVLEKYRPDHMLAQPDAVFMCKDPDDLDAAGAATEWSFTVRPLGPVRQHDMAWTTEIDLALDEGASEDRLQALALNYWNGVASEDPVWEFLTTSAEIVKVEEY